MKLTRVAVFAAGYIIGARAGRERYAQIVESWRRRRSDSRSSARAIHRTVPVALTVRPDGATHGRDGFVVEASILARVLGLRLLTLDATVRVVPAEVTALAPASEPLVRRGSSSPDAAAPAPPEPGAAWTTPSAVSARERRSWPRLGGAPSRRRRRRGLSARFDLGLERRVVAEPVVTPGVVVAAPHGEQLRRSEQVVQAPPAAVPRDPPPGPARLARTVAVQRAKGIPVAELPEARHHRQFGVVPFPSPLRSQTPARIPREGHHLAVLETHGGGC